MEFDLISLTLAQVDIKQIIVVLAYLLLVAYLGYLGYRGTQNAADYMVAGRRTHPFVMALSYGATLFRPARLLVSAVWPGCLE